MADAELTSSYEFGPFCLDSARRRLLRGGELVPLTPKAFETLLALVQHSGRTVEKDDLLARVWCGTIVEENNLVQVISRLRRALGESVDEHSYIVTVPGRGYRFVAAVREVKAKRESLRERLSRGALPLYHALQIALGILATIERLHRAGRIHGRVTPGHVLIAGGEVSLLEPETAGAEDVDAYESPEQLLGEPVHPSSDLFAAGAILFEMLTGTRAFGGSPETVRRATLCDTTPVLGGSRVVATVDQIIHRALAKRPRERYHTAHAMANDLREAWLEADGQQSAAVHLVPRVIVVPFRILRSDPETDFLAFSLPDAITTSLSGLETLVVRSSLAGARFASDPLDLGAIATQANVDTVLTGTLLRDGDQLRVNAQLVKAPEGTVIWSRMWQVPLGRIFHLQDEVVWRIVESLPVSPTASDERLLKHDVPSTARAYECYLRANQLSVDPMQWTVARDLYLQCVTEDSRYAPAWAQLGRIYRLIGTYGDEPADENLTHAEEAFRRAFDLNPDLPLAHHLYTQLEVELGGAEQAMLRLIARAKTRTGGPELFAGLVHACRYCGLLDAAVAAYARARRLDPQIRTSVAHAYWMLGEYEKAIETDVERPPVTKVAALIAIGQEAAALAELKAMEGRNFPEPMHHYIVAMRALLEGRRAECLDATERILQSWHLRDPCARFYLSRHLANIGDTERALSSLRMAIEGGFFCYSVLARDAWLDPLRTAPEFAAILQLAEIRDRHARGEFLQAGGEAVVGLALTDAGKLTADNDTDGTLTGAA